MSRREKRSNIVVAAVTAASAVGGGLAGCHPTGTGWLDFVYGAALAAVVTAAASRANRSVVLVQSGIAVALSRGWLLVPAVAAAAGAFASTFQRRAHRRAEVVIGTLTVQVVMRLPSLGFHGFTALAAAVSVAPVLVSGWMHCARRTRRWSVLAGGGLVAAGLVLTVPVALSALLARHPVERGVSLAHGALDQVEAGQAPAATTQLHAAAGLLASAHSTVGAWWNLGGYLVPVVAQQERALTHATEAGSHLTAVAAANGAKLDLQALRYQGGRIDLAALEAMGPPVAKLDSAVAAAQHQVSASRSPWLVSPIATRLDSLSAEVTKAKSSVDLAALGVQDVPRLLGADGVRHYLVAFMTPAETRGLGGFIGAYGILTVDNGAIKLTASGQATTLAPSAPTPPHLTGPADYLARYGRFAPQKHFEDVTYSPDFPTVEQVLAGLYPQISGVDIDGVMMLDPYALAALLNFTGPITLPGLATQMTSTNAADVLLRTQYLTAGVTASQRHDLLQAALAEGFHRLTSGSLPSPKTMSAVLDPVARQGRLMFWSSHPADQSLLDRLGITGAFPQRANGGDLLAVTVANAGNSKIDAYLHQAVADQVIYDPSTGHVTAKVTIKLQNTAPSSGMPDYVIGSFDEKVIPRGTSYLWLTLYSPLQLEHATDDGGAFGFSPAVAENGVEAYSTYVQVPSESTSTLTVTLKGHVRTGSSYTMTTRLQPLANPQTVAVSARPVAGWYSVPGSAAPWLASSREVQTHTWSYSH